MDDEIKKSILKSLVNILESREFTGLRLKDNSNHELYFNDSYDVHFNGRKILSSLNNSSEFYHLIKNNIAKEGAMEIIFDEKNYPTLNNKFDLVRLMLEKFYSESYHYLLQFIANDDKLVEKCNNNLAHEDSELEWLAMTSDIMKDVLRKYNLNNKQILYLKPEFNRIEFTIKNINDLKCFYEIFNNYYMNVFDIKDVHESEQNTYNQKVDNTLESIKNKGIQVLINIKGQNEFIAALLMLPVSRFSRKPNERVKIWNLRPFIIQMFVDNNRDLYNLYEILLKQNQFYNDYRRDVFRLILDRIDYYINEQSYNINEYKLIEENDNAFYDENIQKILNENLNFYWPHKYRLSILS